MYGVPRKKGRPPSIDSWRAISGEHRPGGPHIFINGGPGIVDAKGKKLYPAAKHNGVTDFWMKPDEGKLGFSMEFGNDPRFLPALYKIGLNLVARNYGAASAALPDYDHIRAFVGQGKSAPALTAVLATEVIPCAVTQASGPIVKSGRPYPMFQVTILGVTLIIDLAPDQPGVRDMRGAATIMGESLYVFPIKRAPDRNAIIMAARRARFAEVRRSSALGSLRMDGADDRLDHRRFLLRASPVEMDRRVIGELKRFRGHGQDNS